MAAVYSDSECGRFLEHMDLARAWARWNGQRGTEAQVLKIMYRIDRGALRRMLCERRGTKVA